ncbi:hypothetical protein, partial [Mariniphaga sediminis]|uniref:hypothetical protein n=1 Tax=Mariniphaga sediminis TaxID=1628158 RepID=UPI0035650FB3
SVADFELETFFPYRVRVFYSDVTRALSAVYQRDYGMMPAEWRTMAILGSASTGLQHLRMDDMKKLQALRQYLHFLPQLYKHQFLIE